MALNDNIKKLREERNLTQQQLADKLKSRLKLQEERKKVQNFLEIIGSIYMGILILGLRPEVQIPIWITIVFACVVIPLIVICLMISKRLREI